MIDIQVKKEDKGNNGHILQEMINAANKGDVIELPASRIKLHSLVIWKPITLIGKPGTVIEISGGSIYIDFAKSYQ